MHTWFYDSGCKYTPDPKQHHGQGGDPVHKQRGTQQLGLELWIIVSTYRLRHHQRQGQLVSQRQERLLKEQSEFARHINYFMVQKLVKSNK